MLSAQRTVERLRLFILIFHLLNPAFPGGEAPPRKQGGPKPAPLNFLFYYM